MRSMRNAMTRVLRWALAVLLGGVSVSWAQVQPDCLRIFGEELKDALGAADARRLYRAVTVYAPDAQTGIQASLLLVRPEAEAPERVFQILKNLRLEQTVPNPFGAGNDQAFFAAVSELVRVESRQYVAAPGVAETIRAAGFENALGTAQAAVFDVYISKLLGGYPRIVGMGREVSAQGVTRILDIAEGVPGTAIQDAAGNVIAILHENKSYVVLFDPAHFNQGSLVGGRFVYPAEFADGGSRLTTIAQEFDREIVIHASTNFSNWRWNFRDQLASQRAGIEQVLLQQFDSSVVTSRFGPAQITQLKDQFTQRLPTHLQFR
jgi:hypothetical protein